MALTTLQCPSCTAPINDVGTCPFCKAEIRREGDLGGNPASTEETEPQPEVDTTPLPDWALQARELMKEDKKLHAIKVIRAGTGWGLKDAKDFVESQQFWEDDAIRQANKAATEAGHTAVAVPEASCFPAATRILTPTGQQNIGDIERGDTVLSTDSNGQLVQATVTHKKSYGSSPITRIVLEGEARNLRTTAHHSFQTNSGWKRASQLQAGDTLLRVDDSGESRLVLIAAITTEAPEPVFNLHTTGPHNFIAEGILAHNFTELRWLRTCVHRLFVDPFHAGTAEGVRA